MKSIRYKSCRLELWLIVISAFFIHSCGQQSISSEFVGQWKTTLTQITVRTEPEKGKFDFTSDSAEIVVIINSDNTADGNIGLANFENARIKKNFGNPEKKGIAIKIECGSITKIFENDPLENKEVELWLGPIKGNIDAELRYTQGGSHFPMAGMIFTRVDQ